MIQRDATTSNESAVDIVRQAQKQAAERPEKLAEIKRSLSLPFRRGDVLEVRVLSIPSGNAKFPPHNASGYFDDLDKAAAAILKYDDRGGNVYVTINPTIPDLLARASNRMVERAKSTTRDVEILTRRWLPIDIDPHRASGIPANAAECDSAHALSVRVDTLLRAEGWGHPLLVSSGNGRYLLYRIDLPNDAQTTALLESFYPALALVLGEPDKTKPYSKIDTTVYNAARILRPGGTTNRKGDGTPDRPHRRCVYLAPVPGCPVDVVPVDVIRAFVAKYGQQSPPVASTTRSPGTNGSGHRLDLPRYLGARGVTYKAKTVDGGTAYIVPCPFDASHGAHGESAAYQADSGKLTFECKHNSCQGKRWEHYRDAIGKPDNDHYDPPIGCGKAGATTPPKITCAPVAVGTVVLAGDRGNYGGVVADNDKSCTVHFRSPEGVEATKEIDKTELRLQNGSPLATGGADANPWPTEEYTAADIATGDFSLTWLIDKVLVANQPAIVGGGWKCLKTGSMVDLGISLASGTDFFRHFPVPAPVKVGFISSESGMFTVSETTKRIAKIKGIDLGALFSNFVVTPESNDFSATRGTEQLVAWCKRREFVVVIIDPAYLNFPGLAETSANVFAVGAALRAFSVALLREGITPIVVHHTVKVPLNKFEPLDLASLSGSGWAEFARQWILLNRRRDYQDGSGFHELNLRIGGSAGHSSLWHLDIDEGPSDQAGDRKWRVGLKTAGQAKVDHDRRKADALGRDLADKMALIVTHLEQLPPNYADTETGILRGSIGRTKTSVIALERLVEQKRITFEDDCVNKAGRKSSRPGYRLVSASGGDEQESDCPV